MKIVLGLVIILFLLAVVMMQISLDIIEDIEKQINKVDYRIVINDTNPLIDTAYFNNSTRPLLAHLSFQSEVIVLSDKAYVIGYVNGTALSYEGILEYIVTSDSGMFQYELHDMTLFVPAKSTYSFNSTIAGSGNVGYLNSQRIIL